MEQHNQGEHLYIQLECCDISLGSKLTLGESFREGDLLKILRQVKLFDFFSRLGSIHKLTMATLSSTVDISTSDASSCK